MPRSFKKDKFLKDYYKCIHYQKLIKKDSAPYIKIRLLNSKGVFDGYLWDMIDFYAEKINEEEIFLLPPKVPHSPQRFKNTIGLVIERKRRKGELDGFQWYCDGCSALLYEDFFQLVDIVKQLPPIFEKFWCNRFIS